MFRDWDANLVSVVYDAIIETSGFQIQKFFKEAMQIIVIGFKYTTGNIHATQSQDEIS